MPHPRRNTSSSQDYTQADVDRATQISQSLDRGINPFGEGNLPRLKDIASTIPVPLDYAALFNPISYSAVSAPPRIPSPEVITIGDLRQIRQGLPTLSLQPWPLDRTQVPIPQGLQDTMDLIGDLISGESGIYRDILEGEPNLESLMRLQDIQNRQFQNTFIPNMQGALASGPYGEGFYGGRTDKLTRDAYLGLADQQAQQRFDYMENVKDRSLQAAGVLPAMASVQDIERQNAIANMERMINTHFNNQQLEIAEFNADMQAAVQALAEAGFIVDQEQFNSNLQFSQNQLETNLSLANASNALQAAQFNSQQLYNSLLAEYESELQFNQGLADVFSAEKTLDAREDRGGLGGFISTIGGLALGAVTGGFGLGLGALGGASLGAQAGSALGSITSGNYAAAATNLATAPLNIAMLQSLQAPATGTDVPLQQLRQQTPQVIGIGAGDIPLLPGETAVPYTPANPAGMISFLPARTSGNRILDLVG